MPYLLKDIEAELLTIPNGDVELFALSTEFGTGLVVIVSGLQYFGQDYTNAGTIIKLNKPLSHGFVSEIEYTINADSPSSIKEMYFEKKYNTPCDKNFMASIVGTSADICIFEAPRFTISGASKIIDNTVVCEFSSITPSNIFTAATADCYTGGSMTMSTCFTGHSWATYLFEDNELVAFNDFFSSTSSASTPTQTQVVNAISANYSTAGYSFTNDGTTFEIDKPFGVSDIRVEICVQLYNNPATCGGDCDEFCVTGCSDTFETLTSGSSNVYIITGQTELDFDFIFTSNTESFLSEDATFKFEVYKYNHNSKIFDLPALLKSEEYEYAEFSATSSITQSIQVSDLNIDGDYLIKGYYEHDVCPEFLNYLNLRHDTSLYKNGTEYKLYDKTFDYYFVAINDAETPLFNTSTDNLQPLGAIKTITLIPQYDEQTKFVINAKANPAAVVTLNGLTMAERKDYTLTLSATTSILEFSGKTYTSDIINVYYVTNANSGAGLTNDTVDISTAIPSGATNGEGSSKVYYNTTQGKYEIFTDLLPVGGNNIIVTLNGVTLANNIDYYQSTSNPKRIILEGLLYVGDIINIIYNAYPEYVGDIFTQTPTIYWSVNTPPDLANGRFVLEVASDINFTTIVDSVEVPYVADQSAYSAQVTLSGSVGTQYYYRVVNYKEYVSLSGDLIKDTKYSEIVPIVVQSNSLNSY